MMKPVPALIGIIAALWLLLAAAADDTQLGAIRTTGLLRVGTTGDYKPFSYRTTSADASGQYIGLDIEMAASLAQALGVKLEIVATSWPTLMQDMAAQRVDIVMSGVSVTPERARQALFSIPYLRDGKTAIARCEPQARFETLAQIDQPGVRLIVNPGGTNERFVRSHIDQAAITVYPDNVTIFDQLIAGRADVMITDAVEARLQQRLHPQLCALHPDAPFEVVEKAYLLSDPALKKFVDDWLTQKLRSGEFAAAFDHWLGYPWNSPNRAALLALMRERLLISVDVAKSKWNSGAPIEDLQRENDIIASLARQAGKAGLPLAWAEQFFRAQIEASKIVQRELHVRWRQQGAGKFEDAPDLARDVRPRLDALTPKLLAAITAAWPELCELSDPARAGVAPPSLELSSPVPNIRSISSSAAVAAQAGLQGVPVCSQRARN